MRRYALAAQLVHDVLRPVLIHVPKIARRRWLSVTPGKAACPASDMVVLPW
ncbi:hypothetical protein Raf01_45660 [Rugosimonospora africana]|uniref:Uncharacterized protein n=1 Tax=Rugosimonospora africana TaxID=556532 RepID=A0A8J3QTS6_9ACTN|nr:hypothetical protein Raf01_45660 [Rugosimonospora africana]